MLTLLKTEIPWATFHVPEDQLKDLPMGKDVKIEVPAMMKVLEAKISFISPLGSFATLVTTQDKAAFDLKTFEIHATLAGDVNGLRPGMTAIIK